MGVPVRLENILRSFQFEVLSQLFRLSNHLKEFWSITGNNAKKKKNWGKTDTSVLINTQCNTKYQILKQLFFLRHFWLCKKFAFINYKRRKEEERMTFDSLFKNDFSTEKKRALYQ